MTLQQIFNVNPQGAMRLVRSDSWITHKKEWQLTQKQLVRAKRIQSYYDYRDKLKELAFEVEYLPRITNEVLVFYISMPKSWSTKKKQRMIMTPCESKPDTDNLIKAFYDALLYKDNNFNDKQIWTMCGVKIWGLQGGIEVYHHDFCGIYSEILSSYTSGSI